MTTTFYVSGIISTVGDKFGLNIGVEGMDTDMCYGLVLTSQQTVTQFLNKHKGIYNYLILDDVIDSEPIIRCVRRAVNADIEVDHIVQQKDCVFSNDGSPVISYKRVDPMSLPRSVELQYISYDRNFAINAQYARNEGARTQQAIVSVQCDFILNDATARELANDLLWRIWSQQLTVSFNHPDLTIEPCDIVQVQADQGSFVIQVLDSMIVKEPNSQSGLGRYNQLSGQLLLTRRGASPAAGSVNSSSSIGNFHVLAGASVVGVSAAASASSFAVTATPVVAGVGDDGGDIYWSNVVLLMGFEDTDGSTGSPGMTDESPAAHGTATGGSTHSQISTAQHKFGSSSLAFDGTSGAVIEFTDSNDWNFGAGNFTVEGFIRPGSVSGFQFIVGQWYTVGNLSWILYLNGDKLAWSTSTSGADNNSDITGTTSLSTATWYHFAIDFDGSKYRLYVNGAMDGSFSTPRSLYNSPNHLSIGSNDAGTSFMLNGNIDELRITKGVARYASDGGFTVPTSAYPRRA